jgi:hypothetical protein
MRATATKQVWRVIAVIAGTITLASCGSNKSLSKDDIQLALGDLRTFAASSRFLTEQDQKGHLTSIFFTRQSDFLLKKVEASAEQLNAPAADHEREREEAARIAAALAASLGKMRDGASAESDEPMFAGLASEAKALEDKLKMDSAN